VKFETDLSADAVVALAALVEHALGCPGVDPTCVELAANAVGRLAHDLGGAQAKAAFGIAVEQFDLVKKGTL
jgi:hypothetical protein